MKQPDKLEWDFRSCPKEELHDAWLYEYKREIGSVLEAVAAWRRDAKKDTFESYYELALQKGIPSLCSPSDNFQFFPEWPERPYLSISASERTRRRKQLFPKKESEYKAAMLSPFVGGPIRLLTDPVERSDLLTSLLEAARRHTSRVPIAPVPGYERASLALLQVDWSVEDGILVDQFRALLACHRPAPAIYKKPKGKGSAPAQSIKGLNALGAYRLREKFGVKGEDIQLFSEATSVSRAIKEAKKIIKGFEELASIALKERNSIHRLAFNQNR